MTGSPTYHQPCHLNEHDELQLVAYIEYMAQCTQLVSIKWIQTMAGRLAVHRYTQYKQYIWASFQLNNKYEFE